MVDAVVESRRFVPAAFFWRRVPEFCGLFHHRRYDAMYGESRYEIKRHIVLLTILP